MSIIYKNKLINHINIHYIKYRSNTKKTDISGLRELQQTKGEVKKRKEIEKIFFLKFKFGLFIQETYVYVILDIN